MTVSMEEIRMKAGSAVLALGNRAAAKGHVESDKKRKAGLVESNFGGLIDPKKIREAIAYYEIAGSIDPGPNGAFAIFQKGLLLEELSEFTEAEQCFLSLAGGEYAQPGAQSAKRCKEKREGNYDRQRDFSNFLQKTLDRVAAAEAGKSTQDAEELAAAAALKFVNFLLDREYDAAKGMLHSSLSDISAKDLKRSFEALFTGETFPESANAFDSLLEWPDKREEDLAHIYVTIDSESSEAVSVVVAREEGRLTIREIEWGRP